MNCYVKVPIIFLLLIKIKIISSFGVKNSIGKDRNSNSTLNWSDKTTSKEPYMELPHFRDLLYLAITILV